MSYYVGDFPPNDYFDTPRGWVCPKCGRVYSPNTSMCWYCSGENVVNTISSTPYKLPDIITSTEAIPIYLNKIINMLGED